MKRDHDASSDDGICIDSLENYERSVGAKKRQRLDKISSEGFVLLDSTFNGLCRTFYKKNFAQISDHALFLTESRTELEQVILNELSKGSIKYNLMLESTFIIPNTGLRQNRAFKTCAKIVTVTSDVKEGLEEDFLKLLLEEEVYTGKGSGYSLFFIDGLMLSVYRYTPLDGTSYIPLPEDIVNRQAVINVVNNNNKCFQYAILSKFVKSDKPQRLTHHYEELADNFNFSDLKYPVPLEDVKIFETM